jgi:hypothetical protein
LPPPVFRVVVALVGAVAILKLVVLS